MKKHAVTSEGVVLNQLDYGEKDQIFVIFTQQFGKVSAFARASRNSQKRFGGKLDLFGLAHFEMTPSFKPSGGLWKLEGAEGLTHFLGMRTHLRAMTLASYIVECVDQFIAPEDPQPHLFRWLLQKMRWLNTVNEITSSDGISVETELLHLCGYSPSWNECRECGNEIAQNHVYFSYERGGVTCRACPKTGQGRWLSIDSRGAASLEDMSRTLGDFTDHILGKPLRTRELKDEIVYGYRR